MQIIEILGHSSQHLREDAWDAEARVVQELTSWETIGFYTTQDVSPAPCVSCSKISLPLVVNVTATCIVSDGDVAVSSG